MKRQTRTEKTFAEDRGEREATAMRLYAALFQHWRDCPSARCRRARACRGERVACFRRWWRALPEPERASRRARLLAAICTGGPR